MLTKQTIQKVFILLGGFTVEQWLEQQSHQKKKTLVKTNEQNSDQNSKNLKLTEQGEANQAGTKMVMKKGVAFCSSLFANRQLASLLC